MEQGERDQQQGEKQQNAAQQVNQTSPDDDSVQSQSQASTSVEGSNQSSDQEDLLEQMLESPEGMLNVLAAVHAEEIQRLNASRQQGRGFGMPGEQQAAAMPFPVGGANRPPNEQPVSIAELLRAMDPGTIQGQQLTSDSEAAGQDGPTQGLNADRPNVASQPGAIPERRENRGSLFGRLFGGGSTRRESGARAGGGRDDSGAPTLTIVEVVVVEGLFVVPANAARRNQQQGDGSGGRGQQQDPSRRNRQGRYQGPRNL